MVFYALYAEGVEDMFLNKKIKPYDSIREIAVSKYDNFKLVYTQTWKISKSSEDRTDLPYFHEAWREINPLLYNNTVILFDGNHVVTTIIKTFEYLKGKTKDKVDESGKIMIDKNGKNIKELCFKNLTAEFGKVKFDYMCLSVLCRRLFTNYTNKLNEFCKSANIEYGDTTAEHSEAIGNLFAYISEKLGTADFMEIKHMSGITLGQMTKNMSWRVKAKKADDNKPDEIVEYDKYFVPCIPISDNYDNFRKYAIG